MAWVNEIAEQQATGELAEVYAEVLGTPLGGRRLPGIPSIMQCMSLRPQARFTTRPSFDIRTEVGSPASSLGMGTGPSRTQPQDGVVS